MELFDAKTIQKLLDDSTPSFLIWMNRAGSDSGTQSLQRAGVVRKVNQFRTACGTVVWLRLTEYGNKRASAGKWKKDPSYAAAEFIEIPVGKLTYISGSQHADLRGDKATVKIRVWFHGNDNAKFLMDLGPAAQWKLSSLPGQHLTLANANRSIVMMIPAEHDARHGWMFRPVDTGIVSGCSS